MRAMALWTALLWAASWAECCMAQEMSPPMQVKVLPRDPLAPPAPARGGEPAIQKLTSEDDHVRITELRVRGQTQTLTVQPKIPGVPAYDIVVPQPGVDPAQDPQAGQRVWWSLKF
jgi:hypothetical protein